MQSTHKIHIGDARKLSFMKNNSVELIVTSPPYPMIEMWDKTFARLNPAIKGELIEKDAHQAFELMHKELDKVWRECLRVLKPGCIACINIGDAVRTIKGSFQIYSNHSRIIGAMSDLGFTPLPDILWRKQTNAPNKFMGSGMLPGCAYVTYEHEYILIFRKGANRDFYTEELKGMRRQSAYFWEERNVWFSDVWDTLKGVMQQLGDKKTRARSGAYPFELAYRLICMYSIYGDTVLDPFAGTGTTTAAAIAACRNSIGVELEKDLRKTIVETLKASMLSGKKRTLERLVKHQEFTSERLAAGKLIKHHNVNHDFPVITGQEKDIQIRIPKELHAVNQLTCKVQYEIPPPNPELYQPPGTQGSLF